MNLDDVADRIVNANHCIMWAADYIRLAIQIGWPVQPRGLATGARNARQFTISGEHAFA